MKNTFTPSYLITDVMIDLDNVCFDFESHFRSLTGFAWNEPPEGGSSWDRLNSGMRLGFFEDMPLFKDAKISVAVIDSWCQQMGANLAFLTALPLKTSYPTWADEKRNAVKKAGFSHEVIIANKAEEKQQWAMAGRVLIDDNPMNIEQWTAKGGIGILFRSWPQAMSDFYAIVRANTVKAA